MLVISRTDEGKEKLQFSDAGDPQFTTRLHPNKLKFGCKYYETKCI